VLIRAKKRCSFGNKRVMIVLLVCFCLFVVIVVVVSKMTSEEKLSTFYV